MAVVRACGAKANMTSSRRDRTIKDMDKVSVKKKTTLEWGHSLFYFSVYCVGLMTVDWLRGRLT